MAIPANSSVSKMTSFQYFQGLQLLYHQSRLEKLSGLSMRIITERRTEAEFRLNIDYRLGKDFPEKRRQQLLTIHFLMRSLLQQSSKGLLHFFTSKKRYADNVQKIMDETASQYSRVLSLEEYQTFMGIEKTEMLPILVDHTLIFG